MSVNIAIVGPGRSRQGTGPYITRTFLELGACISGVVSSSYDSARSAVRMLEDESGVETDCYGSLAELVESKPVDIVAISSPIDSHLRHLEDAIDAGLHIFCEKPLWWPNDASSIDIELISRDTKSLIERCKERGLYLHLNTQWPFTLPAFYELFPSQKPSPKELESFEMWLSPARKGAFMIIDAVPHLLSMVYALAGTGTISNIVAFPLEDGIDKEIDITFDYLHTDGNTRVSLYLRSTNQMPKPAAFAVNGGRVDRQIRMDDYLMSFSSPRGEVQVSDPLVSSIKYFLSGIRKRSEFDDVVLLDGMVHLAQIYKATHK